MLEDISDISFQSAGPNNIFDDEMGIYCEENGDSDQLEEYSVLRMENVFYGKNRVSVIKIEFLFASF